MNETQEQSVRRKEQDRVRVNERRANETEEQSLVRAEANKVRMNVSTL